MPIGRIGASGALLGMLCLGAAACATSGAYNRGKDAYLRGEYDVAVANFRDALQEHPDRTDYKGALQQAMSTASLAHLRAARDADEKGDLELAVVEYRKVYEYDPSNRNSMLRAAEIDKELRERAEAARPRPAIESMRETARDAVARVSQATYDALGAESVTVTGDRGSWTLPVEAADLPDDTVWVPANNRGNGVLADLASPGSAVTVKGAQS